MKIIISIALLALFAGHAQASQCPSPKTVFKAMGSGHVRFDKNGNGVIKDEVGQVSSRKIMGYMDEASVGLNNKYPENMNSAWRAPAGMFSNPKWKFNITLKRGIFGDGEVTFKGSNITYGGQVSCRYDFSEVSGLGLNAVTITGIGAACVPAKARNWKLQIPANKSSRSLAAQCVGSKATACTLACTSRP